MKILKNILLILIFLLSFNTYGNNFHWPIDNFTDLSSSFGEFRNGHLHKGIDIPTNKTIGHPVRSIDDGYIYKIGYSYKGYGKVIYIKHNKSDIISIYAHLERFENQKNMLEDILKFKQKTKNKQYLSFLLENPIKVKKGQIIAFSGETGYGYPHLHLELRDTKNQFNINPLKFFKTDDKYSPVIEKLQIEPIGQNSFINGDSLIKKFKPKKVRKDFYIVSGKINFIPGSKIRLSIDCYDIFNINSANKLGVYSFSIYNGLKKIYEQKFDKIPVDDFLFVERKFNYNWSNIGPTNFSHRLYDPKENTGLLTLDKDTTSLKIVLSDYYNNKSTLLINLNKTEKPGFTDNIKDNIALNMEINTSVTYASDHLNFIVKPNILLKEEPFLKTNKNEYFNSSIKNDKFVFSLPYMNFPTFNIYIKDFLNREYSYIKNILCGQLKDNIKFDDFILRSKSKRFFGLETEKTDKKALENSRSDIITLLPENAFIDKAVEIKSENIKKSNISFYKYNPITKKWSYRYTHKKDQKIYINTYNSGKYMLMEDNIPPDITFKELENEIIFYFNDELSGIIASSIKIFRDQQKLEPYYDIDRKCVKIPHEKGPKKQTYEISVRDYEYNLTSKSFTF